jgi:hypothetical protein
MLLPKPGNKKHPKEKQTTFQAPTKANQVTPPPGKAKENNTPTKQEKAGKAQAEEKSQKTQTQKTTAG